jgi:hypothetical protein
VQESGNGVVFGNPVTRREIENVDAVQVAIGRFAHELLDRVDRGRIRRLAQDSETAFSFVHA